MYEVKYNEDKSITVVKTEDKNKIKYVPPVTSGYYPPMLKLYLRSDKS